MFKKKDINIKTKVAKRKTNKLELIIFIISIISIILSFFFYLYVIPICILGIIISILFRKKSKLYYLNIILFFICIILSIILQIFFKPKPFNDLVGTWNCKYYNNSSYVVSIKINSKNSFIWSKYNDSNKNYIIGSYKLEKIDKKDEIKSVKYYNFILNGDKYFENGIEQNKEYSNKYEVAINNNENKAILINKENMILKCDKVSTDNPIID